MMIDRTSDKSMTQERLFSRASRSRHRPGSRLHPSMDREAYGERWLVLLLIIAPVIAYANSFHGAFILDDHRSIEHNARLRDLGAVTKLFSGRRPVVDLTLAFNYAAGGLKTSGYHLVNLLIHLLAGLTLYGIVRRSLQREPLANRFGPAAARLALVIALLWVVHPLQTQSVTYLIQRCESLMGFFYLLTLYCVIRGCDSSRARIWYGAAVIACALGMGSKAVMVTAPVVVFLYDRVFLSKSLLHILRRRGGLYLGLAATWSILWMTGTAHGVLDPSATNAHVGLGFKGITPAQYALTQFGVLLEYLKLSLWPHPLCLDYDWPVALDTADYVLPGTIILALLLLTLWGWAKKPALGFVGGWFFLILLPTSSFIPIKDPLFEHRLYLPLAAVAVLVALAGFEAINAVSVRWVRSRSPRRWLTMVPVTAVVLVFCLATIRRNQAYASELTMWGDVTAKRPLNPRARYNYGMVWFDRHQDDKAMAAFRKTLQIDPTFVEAHYNLAKALSRQGRLEEAAQKYRDTLRVNPRLAMAHNDLANVLVRLGRVEQAIPHYLEAMKVQPRFVRPYFNLGNVLLAQGKIDEAVSRLRQAVQLDPETPEIHYMLANALRRQGHVREAIEQYRETLRRKPDHVRARQALKAIQGRS